MILSVPIFKQNRVFVKGKIPLIYKLVLEIRRGNRDNLGIIIHIAPLKHFVTHY